MFDMAGETAVYQ